MYLKKKTVGSYFHIIDFPQLAPKLLIVSSAASTFFVSPWKFARKWVICWIYLSVFVLKENAEISQIEHLTGAVFCVRWWESSRPPWTQRGLTATLPYSLQNFFHNIGLFLVEETNLRNELFPPFFQVLETAYCKKQF